MTNAQEWLDQNYPNNGKRSEVEELNFPPYLNGFLDLSDFTNVKEINISSGQITSLNLNGLSRLERLRCPNNNLTSLYFLTGLSSEKLKEIYLSDNEIHSDLTPFSGFFNLEKLHVGNLSIYCDKKMTKQGNSIEGGLEPLKYLTKLKELGIENTDIDGGLEYLSDNVEEFYFLSRERPRSKVMKFFSELEPFFINLVTGRCNLKTWKDLQKGLINSNVEKDWFTPFHWITEKEISWAWEKIIQYHPQHKHKFAGYLIIPEENTAETQTSHLEPYLSALLNELTNFTGELVFIPVNNLNHLWPHWSLLVYESISKKIYHFDTREINSKCVEPLVKELLQRLHQGIDIDFKECFKSSHIVCLGNSWDCGVAVIEMIKKIVESYPIARNNLFYFSNFYLNFSNKLEDIAFGDLDFAWERKKWRNLLTDCSKAQTFNNLNVNGWSENKKEKIKKKRKTTQQPALLKNRRVINPSFKKNQVTKEPIYNKNNWFVPQKWLTDQEIDWALEQTTNQFPYQQISQFKILETTQFMFANETPKQDIEAAISFPVLLNELTGFNGKLVFIPINNPDFHWSLLVYEKATQTFHHWDTLPSSPNHGYIKPLVKDLLQQLQQTNNPNLDQYLVLRDEIKQPNSWDCGVAVIEVVKRIIERYDNNLGNIDLGEFNLPQTRKEWQGKLGQELIAQIRVFPK